MLGFGNVKDELCQQMLERTCVDKREPSYMVGGTVNWYSHYGRLYRSLLQKLNQEPLYDPTSGHVSGQNYNLKRYMHLHVHCSTIYKSQDEGAN